VFEESEIKNNAYLLSGGLVFDLRDLRPSLLGSKLLRWGLGLRN
jgi:hypothetical protein